MTRTPRRWRRQILAWHTTGVSNGPTEGLNALIKKIKRIVAGFRTFTHHGSASSSTPAAATRPDSAP